ncbi:LysE/ArgO family amino acid transporter [uncultured Helicobacter sp.]|uniref:LysE/ArgO family amino acid transporter n=2 Tax=uncultured Helicobacter sp. TaxID=175537 RepID=UPI0025DDF675|nr:LysE/ArgO family amino acid transporter [uncultured Helicobacter sp.]
MYSFWQGFLVSFGLCSAIGAQNAFVIKQAIKKEHTLFVCATCVSCDVVLMSVGVLGFGSIFAESALWSKILAILGAIFLCYYGISSCKAALQSHKGISIQKDSTHSSLSHTIRTALSITLLNPHVYLDAIVLLGSLGVSVQSQVAFLIGCIGASMAWFALLGFGANALSNYFTSPLAWRILEGIVACMMFGIAISLIIFALA